MAMVASLGGASGVAQRRARCRSRPQHRGDNKVRKGLTALTATAKGKVGVEECRRQETGDNCISPPESSPFRSSISQRRLVAFLVHLAGSGEVVGDCSGMGDGGGVSSGFGWSAVSTDGDGGAGIGAEIRFSQGAATAARGGASEPKASVAAALRGRRRRFVAGAVVVGSDGGMEQTTETSCRPEAWRTEKRALYASLVQVEKVLSGSCS